MPWPRYPVIPMTDNINGHELKRRRFAEKVQELMQSEQPDPFSALSVCAFVVATYISQSKQPMALEQEFQRMLKRALEVTYEQKGKEQK